MPIRITTIAKPSQTVLKVDGRLAREDVGELERMVRERKGPTALDLTELQAIDREAAVVLREILELGVELCAASPYIKLLLEKDSNRQPRDSEDRA